MATVEKLGGNWVIVARCRNVSSRRMWPFFTDRRERESPVLDRRPMGPQYGLAKQLRDKMRKPIRSVSGPGYRSPKGRYTVTYGPTIAGVFT